MRDVVSLVANRAPFKILEASKIANVDSFDHMIPLRRRVRQSCFLCVACVHLQRNKTTENARENRLSIAFTHGSVPGLSYVTYRDFGGRRSEYNSHRSHLYPALLMQHADELRQTTSVLDPAW